MFVPKGTCVLAIRCFLKLLKTSSFNSYKNKNIYCLYFTLFENNLSNCFENHIIPLKLLNNLGIKDLQTLN